MSQYAEKARVEQAIRKSDIGKAVDEANLECQEAEKLRESTKELNATQGRNASELKLKLGNEESNISTMWAEIADTLEELALIQKQYDEHNERAYAENARVDKEIVKAKEAGDFVKGAFERARRIQMSSVPCLILSLPLRTRCWMRLRRKSLMRLFVSVPKLLRWNPF